MSSNFEKLQKIINQAYQKSTKMPQTVAKMIWSFLKKRIKDKSQTLPVLKSSSYKRGMSDIGWISCTNYWQRNWCSSYSGCSMLLNWTLLCGSWPKNVQLIPLATQLWTSFKKHSSSNFQWRINSQEISMDMLLTWYLSALWGPLWHLYKVASSCRYRWRQVKSFNY